MSEKGVLPYDYLHLTCLHFGGYGKPPYC
jgi:hypothetical protein